MIFARKIIFCLPFRTGSMIGGGREIKYVGCEVWKLLAC